MDFIKKAAGEAMNQGNSNNDNQSQSQNQSQNQNQNQGGDNQQSQNQGGGNQQQQQGGSNAPKQDYIDKAARFALNKTGYGDKVSDVQLENYTDKGVKFLREEGFNIPDSVSN